VNSPTPDAEAGHRTTVAWTPPRTVGDVDAALRAQGYLPGDGLATAIFLAIELRRPLFLEGEPGVGKTEVGHALGRWVGSQMVRLQCYEGIDVNQAVYEWDYQRQLLHLRAQEVPGVGAINEDDLFSERFLIRRPLLQAITGHGDDDAPTVLLIDEVDRADDEFEAYLLEMLADFTITIPELGTFRATRPPIVVLTSNRTRDVHDALKRRSLYHWVEHPGFEREVAIILSRVPEAGLALAEQITRAVQGLRELGLYKSPGVAEAIDWARALRVIGVEELDEASAVRTLGAVLKYREDAERATPVLRSLLETTAGHG
jgi:MoxR-like ATPase